MGVTEISKRGTSFATIKRKFIDNDLAVDASVATALVREFLLWKV